MSKLEIPESWAEAPIDTICEVNPRNRDLDDQLKVGFVPMASVSEEGYVKNHEVREWSLVKKGFTHFADNDVIFAKITPCMENKKSAIIHGMPNGVGCGSTEFHVLRPKGHLTPQYILGFLRQDSFVAKAENNMTGSAGQKRVPTTWLAKQQMPVPPLGEQKRIVAKIESTQEKIKTIEQSVTKAEELIGKYREALLQKAFRGELVPQDPDDEPASKLLERIRADRAKQNDGKKKKKDDLPPIKTEEIPFEIPNSWEWVRLGELGELARGKSKHRPRNDPKLFGGKYPFIQTGDVAAAKGGIIYSYEQTLSEFGLKQSRLFPKETLCITIAANIADTAVLGIDCAFPDSVVGFTPLVDDSVARYLVKFVQFYLQATKEEIDRKAHGAAQKNINLEFLESLLIPLPSTSCLVKTVKAIEEGVSGVGTLDSTLKQIKDDCNKVSSSVLGSAFYGRLVPQIPSEGTGHELLEKIKSQSSVIDNQSESKPKPKPKKRVKA